MNESTARAPSRVPFRDPSRTSTRRPKSSASPRRYSSPNSGSTSRGQDCQRRPRVQYSPRCSALGLPGARAYAVTGTPSDCVILGLGPLAEGDIGLVVSGINKGANVGNAVLGSGTTMATRVAHARSPRIPSIAVSLSLHGPRDHREPLFSLAARVSELLARRLVEGELPDGVTLNVNVPSVPRGETRGIAVTRLSPIGYWRLRTEQGGDGLYYNKLSAIAADHPDIEEGTDVWALNRGLISISPLRLEVTDEIVLPALREHAPRMESALERMSRSTCSVSAGLRDRSRGPIR